ncbi:hypothetical protein LguiB_024667 [Lonicera macranthoides]
MKIREQTGSKGHIIQGPARRTAAPSGETKDIKGVFTFLKKILHTVECIGKKVDRIGKKVNLYPHASEDDEEAQVEQPAAFTSSDEETLLVTVIVPNFRDFRF